MNRAVAIFAAGMIGGYFVGSISGAKAERLSCLVERSEVDHLAFELEHRAERIAGVLEQCESVAAIWHERAGYFQQLYIEEWIARRRNSEKTAGLVH